MIKEKIEIAINELIKKDAYLLHTNVNERSLTHKLALYLQDSFEGYDVDCEYNRNGTLPKEILITKTSVESDDLEAVTVYPDIIIHKRGQPPQGTNYVVIEAKKHGGQIGKDETKLKLYKEQLGYTHAVMVVFPMLNEDGDLLQEFRITEV